MLVILLLFCADPTIVHIRDWHYVPKEAFAIDTGLQGKQLDRAYEKHLKAVERVQQDQRKLLKGVKEVYKEGLSDRDYFIFKAEIEVLRNAETIPRETLLRIGAAGQLMIEGKLTVLPAEDDLDRFNPVRDGTVELDEKEIEEREDLIVKRLLRPGTHYLILGGAHNLADNIKRLSPRCVYKVLTPKTYPE